MNRPRTAAATIIALTLLALCCQALPSAHLHSMMTGFSVPAAHFMLLLMTLPAQALLSLLLLALAILLFAVRSSPEQTRSAPVPAYYRRPPDDIFATVLRLGLADGILDPKPF